MLTHDCRVDFQFESEDMCVYVLEMCFVFLNKTKVWLFSLAWDAVELILPGCWLHLFSRGPCDSLTLPI